MSVLVLRLREPPALRVDARALDARALASSSAADAARVVVRHGNAALELGELFRIGARTSDGATPEVRFEGDLSRFDRIGWKLADARITIDGGVGDYVGAAMTGGDIDVHGHAGLFAGCAMAGGRLAIHGDVGDFAGGAFAGDMEGMRGGTLVVRGNAGARFGDRMRRGTAVVAGDVGAFAGSRMVAGTIAVGGTAGAHAGFGVRRGTLVFAGSTPPPDPTFATSTADVGVIWRLLARDLERFGGAFGRLSDRHARRYVGDLAFEGKGELLFVA